MKSHKGAIVNNQRAKPWWFDHGDLITTVGNLLDSTNWQSSFPVQIFAITHNSCFFFPIMIFFVEVVIRVLVWEGQEHHGNLILFRFRGTRGSQCMYYLAKHAFVETTLSNADDRDFDMGNLSYAYGYNTIADLYNPHGFHANTLFNSWNGSSTSWMQSKTKNIITRKHAG